MIEMSWTQVSLKGAVIIGKEELIYLSQPKARMVYSALELKLKRAIETVIACLRSLVSLTLPRDQKALNLTKLRNGSLLKDMGTAFCI